MKWQNDAFKEYRKHLNEIKSHLLENKNNEFKENIETQLKKTNKEILREAIKMNKLTKWNR